MPRRPPPSPLVLHTGPIPPRSRPKHSLPSIPRRTFYPTKLAPIPAPPSTLPRVPGIIIPTPALGPLPSSPEMRTKSPLRGPWDHSRSLSESTFVVDNFLRHPEPAAVTVVVSLLPSPVW